MATLSMRDIKRKIRSIKNIQVTTRAMMLVSAAKLKKYEVILKNHRLYIENLKDSLLSWLKKQKYWENEYTIQKNQKNLLILITSQRGLCGAFNSRLNQEAQILASKENTCLFIIGKKGYDFFKRRGYKIMNYFDFDEKFENFFDRLFDSVLEVYKEFGIIKVLYTHFESALRQRIRKESFLPIKIEEKSYSVDYLYEPAKTQVVNQIFRLYLKNQLKRYLIESLTSEHAARMISMQQATQNATALIDKLWLDFNKARQASITKEIADIINATEAIKKI